MGCYQAEVLVADSLERTFKNNWNLEVAPKGRQRDVPLIVPLHPAPTLHVP